MRRAILGLTALSAILFGLAAHSQEAKPFAIRPKPLVVVKDAPPVQVFVPGFTVRELPIALSNINNVAYAPDGRLFAAGYDGRLHLLKDTDGDGLEDKVITFHDKKSDDFPLGMAIHKNDLYVCRGYHIARHRDTDGDGVPDTDEVVATGWKDDETAPKDPLYTHRRVDEALALAIAPDDTMYVSFGAANYANGYLKDKAGKSHYDLTSRRGTVAKISPDGKTRETIATGVRYIVAMEINRHGDLFATDQEGATWLPNGNPFDELLHIQSGRHYGFPPRHPTHLPNVIDEPSAFDYSPQHQSTCGFRFNDPPKGGKPFGPAEWAGDAFIVGQSRGKLYRTKLVKTPAGYVAQNQIVASIGMLPIGLAISPTGDMVICCHSGPPDWGTGPAGMGKLFKISYSKPDEPQPVLTWAASPTETHIAFDRPLDPAKWKNLAAQSSVEGGLYVGTGDRFERFRPGYEVVKAQMATPRYEYPVLSAGIENDGRTIVLRTPPRTDAYKYSITLPYPEEPKDRAAGIDLAYDLTGVAATWKSDDGNQTWTGWLPHFDWTVSNELTAPNPAHALLRDAAKKPGKLTLRGQLDLYSMLRPAVQPGAKLDFEYPAEVVTIAFRSKSALALEADKTATVVSKNGATKLTVSPEKGRWIPFALTLATGDSPLSLDVSWTTKEDARPRPFPLHRVLLPWAVPPRDKLVEHVRNVPEIAGGNWAEGKKVFFGEKALCAKCHTVRGEGANLGPDLSNLVFRDYESVMRDVREPSATINPDYLAYRVDLESGATLTGVLNGSNDKEVHVADAAGKVTVVPRKDVNAIVPSKTSVMPEKLLDGLTDQQRKDLLTFLLTDPPVK